MSVNDINDFKIIYGENQSEIEEQIEVLKAHGYLPHGSIVAQANPDFYTNPAGASSPFLYYQMLARQKTVPAREEATHAPAE